MGLFGKKEPCPICGGEVTGLFKSKIGGGRALCRSCGERTVLPREVLKKADVALIQEHLEYREQEAALYATMEPTYQFEFGRALHITVDEPKQLVAIDFADWNSGGNPLVLHYGQLIGYELYRQGKKLDDDKTPGFTFSHTLTSVFGKALGTTASESDLFDLKLKTTHKYWPIMNIIVGAPEHFETKGLVNNMSSVGGFFKSVVRKEEFVLDGEHK